MKTKNKFSVHYPTQTIDQALEILSLTKTNSPKTSSLPLADFWHPDRCNEQKDQLFKVIGLSEQDMTEAHYCFEYPTPAYRDCCNGQTIRYSRPSMTDLMIILNNEQRITIEAKYTEYINDSEYAPTLMNWREDKAHKADIMQCWIDYIFEGGFGKVSCSEDFFEHNKNFPYQFLHRTASCCFGCKRPILLYQLFYDNENKEKLKEFENKLKDCAEKLQLNSQKLPFYIVEVKVTKIPQKEGNYSNIFIDMKSERQYEFDENISVLNGYTLERIL